MTKKKRPLCRAVTLLLGILTLLLSACTGGNTPADTTGTQSAPAPSATVRDLVGDYTIVYPTRATDGETAAAMQLAKFFGGSERPKADYTADGTVPSGAREILIGNTNRASSKAAIAALGRDRDFTVSASTDGENWTVLDERHDSRDDITDVDVPKTAAKYVRLTVSKGGDDGVVRIADMELYGEI